jgi:hypothetical protein
VIDYGNVLTGDRSPVLNNDGVEGANVHGIMYFGNTTDGVNINRQTHNGEEKLVIGNLQGFIELVPEHDGPGTSVHICIRSDGVLRIRGAGDPCGTDEIETHIYLRL